MRPRIGAAALLLIALLAVPALGATRSPALKLRSTSLGRVIVDSHGRTLYMFGADKTNRSHCKGGCAAAWPPAIAGRKPTVGAGLSRAKLKVIRRSDGRRQLSYAGHPLYRFSGDARAGDVNGDGLNEFGGIWHAVSRTGAAAMQPAPAPAPAPTSYPY